MQKLSCEICPKHCALKEGAVGVCRGRKNDGGKIVPLNYGHITSIALDPIEKKPLYHFFPNHYILSVGSYGCNLRCPFCQNYSISMADSSCDYRVVSPEDLLKLALECAEGEQGNLGIAFTYNEPLISYEFVYDCSRLFHEHQLKTVLVTNGQICEAPLLKLLPFIDAMNIDLKGFSEDFYHYVKGSFNTVLDTIRTSYDKTHIEVTTLIIPGKNDSFEQMEEECRFLSSLSEDIPLHISRFFPRYKENSLPPTPVDTIDRLCAIARRYLKYVHKGNC